MVVWGLRIGRAGNNMLNKYRCHGAGWGVEAKGHPQVATLPTHISRLWASISIYLFILFVLSSKIKIIKIPNNKIPIYPFYKDEMYFLLPTRI